MQLKSTCGPWAIGRVPCFLASPIGARSKFSGVSGAADRGGGDNSIQFINIGREGDKSFKEWRRKIGAWKGG